MPRDESNIGVFNDFPKFGVWPDGYYMGINTFDFGGPSVVAFDRSSMLNGSPAGFLFFFTAVQTGDPRNCFLLMPSDLDGPAPPPGTPNFFTCIIDDSPNDAISIYEFKADFNNPANSSFTQVANVLTAPFDLDLCDFGLGDGRDCIPQPGTSQKLDPLPLFYSNRMQFRDFGTHQTF